MRQMRMPQLDERLQKVFDLFPACDAGADIGADHGRLSCNLLAYGKVKHMQVTDISAPSLEKARKLIEKHGLSDRTGYGLGDGLSALKEQVQAIAICGMGGELISGILKNGTDHLHGAALILCPQTDLSLVRKTVAGIGYMLTHEEAVLASGRYYVVMRAKPGEVRYTDKELFLGPVLMKSREEITKKYYRWRFDVEGCVKDKEQKYFDWLKEVM